MAHNAGSALLSGSGATAIGQHASRHIANPALHRAVSSIAQGATLFTEAALAAGVARTTIVAAGRGRLAKANDLDRISAEILQVTQVQVSRQFEDAVRVRDNIVRCVDARSANIRKKYEEPASRLNSVPSDVDAALLAIRELPEPVVLMKEIPDEPSALDGFDLNLSQKEASTINFLIRGNHPAVAALICSAKVFGSWIGEGVSFLEHAEIVKGSAELYLSEVRNGCKVVLKGQQKSCDTIKSLCERALRIYNIYAAKALLLEDDNRNWFELTQEEKEDVVTLLTVRAELSDRLRNAIRSVEDVKGV